MSRTKVAGLALSAAALVSIALHEGYSDRAYQPVPGDKQTIGFGTTEGVRPGDRITPPKALERALRDVQKFEGAIKDCVKVPLYQHEYDSMIAFTYNVGSSAFCNSTLVKKLNSGDYEGACNEMTRWVYFQGKPLAGLVKRREAERQLCLGNKTK